MPDRQIVVEAAEGRNTGTSVALVADHAAYTPSIWVVSLGTNDNSDEFADNAEALMELAGHDRCVLWYDVYRPVEVTRSTPSCEGSKQPTPTWRS